MGSRRLRFAMTAAVVSMAGGLLALLGWAFQVEVLKSVVPGFPSVKPTTALCFLLAGVVLWLRLAAVGLPRAVRLAIQTAGIGLVAMIGGMSLVGTVFGLDLRLDQLMFAAAVREEGGAIPGRMAGATALNFVLIAAALATFAAKSTGLRCFAEACTVLALLIGLVGLAGYHLGEDGQRMTGPFSSLALPTATLFALLPLGILAARGDGGLAGVVFSDHVGGTVAQRLIPLGIVLPLAAEWLRKQGELAGLFPPLFGEALVAVTVVAAFCGAILFMAHGLNRLGEGRERSAQLVEMQNRALQRVAMAVPLEASLDALLRDIERLYPEMLTSVLLLDEDGKHIRHGAAPRLPAQFVAAINGQPIGPEEGSCGTAAWRRQPVVVEDIARDPLWAKYRDLAAGHGLAACWSTPIFGARGILLGTFAIYYDRPKRPDASHPEVIDRVTQTVAIAISGARAAQALAQGRADLEAAQMRGNLGSWELDLGSPRGRWSRQLYRLFDRDPSLPAPTLEELLQQVHPQDAPALGHVLTHPEELAAPRHLDFRLPGRAGEVRTLSGTFEVGRDAQGIPVTMAGTVLDVTERKRAETALQLALTHARDLSRRLATVEEQERRAIGREVHDRIGTDLAAAKLNLDLISAALPTAVPAAVSSRLTDTANLLQSAINHSRNILAELRPPGLDEGGLLLALQLHGEAVERRSGVVVCVRGTGIEPALPLAETALFRIAQEALSNVAMHAAADTADVILDQEGGTVRLTIVDDGTGFRTDAGPGAGYGLRTMRERAEGVDARFEVESHPGKGTRVRVSLERAAWP